MSWISYLYMYVISNCIEEPLFNDFTKRCMLYLDRMTRYPSFEHAIDWKILDSVNVTCIMTEIRVTGLTLILPCHSFLRRNFFPGNPGGRWGLLSWKSRQEGEILCYRKSRWEVRLKNDPISWGGGGVWIFFGITHSVIYLVIHICYS